MQTTVGQLLVNAELPAHLRDYNRVLDKKGVAELLEKVAAENNPDLYRQVVQSLHQIGQLSSQSFGSSFSLADFKTPPKTKLMTQQLDAKVHEVVDRQDLTDDQKDEAIKAMTFKATPILEDTLLEELKAANNPFHSQLTSGARGGRGDVRSLFIGDLMVADHKQRPIPMPITTSMASGYSPADYWASSYGARYGTLSVKLATQRSGFLGKQLIQAAHKQVVTEHDCKTDQGIPVAADDNDNIGTILAKDVGEYKAGTIINPKMHKLLAAQNLDKQIYVRSALTCEAKNGMCAKCAGIRERGRLPEIGDNLGIAAAQALAEKTSQGALSAKHGGGRAKGELSSLPTGFKLINQMVQVPKQFTGSAAISKLDGVVREVREAPQGGTHIMVGDTQHFVPVGLKANVTVGQRVEEGDLMSEGIPNPSELVEHKGLGAGRLDFVNTFKKAFKDSGLSANRRNIEVLTRGLINHVHVTESDGVDNALPGDLVEYSTISRNYRPRYGFKVARPAAVVGHYLERPANQYSIGTRVTKRVADDLDKSGVQQVTAHAEPPPFQPKMVRAMEHALVSPDWQTRLGGSYMERGLLDSLHKGVPSAEHSTSYIPALAKGIGFGEKLTETGEY